MSNEAIVVENLKKSYKTKKRLKLFKSKVEIVEALRGISFRVNYGEVVGLLGPNGAGKTTTIKILSTLLLPDDGKAFVGGYDVVKEANQVRKIIGVMLTVEKGFYGKLTGRENLEYFGALYDMDPKVLKQRIEYLTKLLDLDNLGATYKLYEEFSLGMKARLSLARALLKDPPILLLDEPTLGLDPPSARKIRELVKEMAKNGKAILYTTHNMFEAEIVCDRIIMINKGRIVAEGTPEDIKTRIPKIKTIVLTIKRSPYAVRVLPKIISEKLNINNEFIKVNEDLNEVKIFTKKPEDILNDILKFLASNNIEIHKLRLEEPTLEDAFIYFAEGS